MIFVRRAMVVACVIFAGCMVGVLVQHFLPKGHLADAKDAITTIQGLVTVLLALVLGLLIWTSYGIYSTQQSEVHTLGSQILQLGLALDSYGPEADRGQELLKKELIATRERFWGGDGAGPAQPTYCQSRAELRDFDGFFCALKPATDEQRHLLDTARQLSASIVQTHYLMARQLSSPFHSALLVSVACWATLLFTCVGALLDRGQGLREQPQKKSGQRRAPPLIGKPVGNKRGKVDLFKPLFDRLWREKLFFDKAAETVCDALLIVRNDSCVRKRDPAGTLEQRDDGIPIGKTPNGRSRGPCRNIPKAPMTIFEQSCDDGD